MPKNGTGVHALKRYGQHWLEDPDMLARIVAAAELSGQETVLEIGPGMGSLTEHLLAVAPVVAVEVDPRLTASLRKRFSRCAHFQLIEGDITQMDPPATPRVVVANIPYNISSPILEKLLGSATHPHRQFSCLVLLMQKELAERICAREGSRVYGALSVRLQYLAQCELVFPVPRRFFRPPPRVDSAVIRLKPRAFFEPLTSPNLFEQVVRQAFATRRKMLHNCLKSLIEEKFLRTVMGELGLNPQARAEDISVINFVKLVNRLEGAKSQA